MDKQHEKFKTAQIRATLNFTDSLSRFEAEGMEAYAQRDSFPAMCGIEEAFAAWAATTRQNMTQASGELIESIDEAEIIRSKKANTKAGG